jgi:hypothetical protein
MPLLAELVAKVINQPSSSSVVLELLRKSRAFEHENEEEGRGRA